MAEAFEAEIRIKGVDEAVRDLRKLEGQLDDTGESMEGAGSSSSSMASSITAGVVAAQAAWTAITKLAAAVKAAADEFERQSGIINRFVGNVDEAARRTNGLISQLDLMTAQSRAAASGLTLTSDQFATISVRASEFAAATGGDATSALNALIGAIATGRSGELLKYGVDLQGITEITDKQSAAIAGLTDGYGDAESAADTLGGRIAVLETRLDNLQTELIQAVNDTGLAEDAWDNLTSATDTLLNALGVFGEPDGPISSIEAFVINSMAQISAFTQQVEAAATGIRAFFTLMDNPADLEAAQRLSEAMNNIGGEAFGRQMAEAQVDGIMNTVNAQERRARASNATASTASRSRSRTRSNRNEPEDSAPDTSAQDELTRLIAEQLRLEEQLLENNANKAAIGAELAKIEQERLALLEQQTAEAQKQKQLIIEQREAEQERQALMKRATRVQDGITQGLDGIASITKKTIQLTEEGGMSAKDAFVTATDEWLKQFAISEAWKGAAAGIEAIGAAIMNAPHAAAKAAEAAGHFALAAAAGGASAAIPNAAAGGSADSGASRPEAATGGANTGGGITNVVNFNSPVADSQLGAMQNRASRAAARRFDA